MKLRLGHSPDADDAFMFYALAEGRLDCGPYEFEHVVEGIESLNRRALQGELEISALSAHAYAYIADRYALLRCGASMGEGCGPIVVALRPLSPEELLARKIAVPGTLTTAFLLLQLRLGPFQYIPTPFDHIMEEVRQGRAEAGLLIHEGQLTYRQLGLHKVLDLGKWWQGETGLPLPLGVNAIRKDLGAEAMQEVAALLRQSIVYALEHREEALQYALQHGRGMSQEMVDGFVGMYVNRYTRDLGDEGERALHELYRRAQQALLIPTLFRYSGQGRPAALDLVG